MKRIIGETKKLDVSAEVVYNFLSNLNNFSAIRNHLGADVFNWELTERAISFESKKIGVVTINIVELKAFTEIKIAIRSIYPYRFSLWFEIKPESAVSSFFTLSVRNEANIIFRWMMRKQIKNFVYQLSNSLVAPFVKR